MKAISSKHVLKQLKDDLIGKDSYRGVTLTYTWLANQFGHFSLGFIPTCFIWRRRETRTLIHRLYLQLFGLRFSGFYLKLIIF